MIGVITGLVLGGAVALACDGNAPVVPQHVSGYTVTLGALGLDAGANPPADLTWNVDGIRGSKHFNKIGQFSGSKVKVHTANRDPHVTLDVTSKTRISCSINLPNGQSPIEHTGTEHCHVEA